MRVVLLRSLLVLLLAVCVPFQAALAASAAPETAIGHCLDGHDGHGKPSGSHCGGCAAAAIAGAIHPIAAFRAHDTAQALPGLPLRGTVPDSIDRPPRAS